MSRKPSQDLIPYAGHEEWLIENTIYWVVHGSRAYGTDRPDSDLDFKGVTVPPRAYRDGFLRTFHQCEGPWHGDVDAVIFGIQKFFKLAANCNPNIIEVLWVAEDDLIVCTDVGQRLRDARTEFLSKKALHTFRGYAMSQLRRIESHRRWLLDPPDHQPTRKEFGLPETTVIPKDQLGAVQAAIAKKVDSWEIDFGDMEPATKIYIQQQIRDHLTEINIGADERFNAAGRLLGLDDNFLNLMDRERRYGQARNNWRQFNEWVKNRNAKRAALEARYGYDVKHGMHLVRLMRMCREILEEGLVWVRRPDAEELKGIRNGEWSYDHLMEWANQQDRELIEVADASDLPKQPNRNRLDELCQDIIRSMHG